MKEKTRRFRLTAEQDQRLEETAAEEGFEVSQYIRRQLGLEGLSDRAVASDGSQPKGQRLAGNRGSVPVAESQVPQDKNLIREIKKYEARGKSHDEAKALARRTLGLS